jgi:hypothetical protein
MTLYSLLASLVLALHLLFILWVVFGALLTRRRPLLRWFHIASLVWGVLVEILPWPCPLTPAENWLRGHAGLSTYAGGFLLHYLDAAVYPDVPPGLLTAGAVVVCLFNLGIYLARFRRRNIAGW